MDDRQEAVVDMYQEVDRFFIKEKDKVALDAILKNHSDKFHTNVVDIARYVHAQEWDSKGYAVKKQAAKKDLSIDIFKLTSGFCSFAIDTKNQPIEKEFDVSLTYVNKKSDAKFVNYSNRLQTELGEYIKELAPYHILEADLENLTKQTQAYSDLLHLPDEIIKDKSIATNKIKELISDGNKMLVDSIDRDMNYYKETDEAFYNEYIKRKEIYDNQTFHLSLFGNVTGEISKLALQFVAVTIVRFKAGADFANTVKTTTKLGNYRFKDLEPGKYKITFELDGYDTLTIEFTLHKGESKRLDVALRVTE